MVVRLERRALAGKPEPLELVRRLPFRRSGCLEEEATAPGMTIRLLAVLRFLVTNPPVLLVVVRSLKDPTPGSIPGDSRGSGGALLTGLLLVVVVLPIVGLVVVLACWSPTVRVS